MKVSMQELLVVLVIVIIIFGPTQIPKLTKMVGRSIHSFKDGMNSDDDTKSSEEK